MSNKFEDKRELMRSFEGDYILCAGCDRTYKKDEMVYDQEEAVYLCGAGCGQPVWMDSLSYVEERGRHPEWPIIPKEGVSYPWHD